MHKIAASLDCNRDPRNDTLLVKLSNKHLAILAVIACNLIWGTAPPIFKWSLSSVEPITLGFFRFFLGTLFILPLTAFDLKITKKDAISLAIAGFFSVFLNIFCYFIGLRYAPSINVTIIGAAGPIFVLIASGYFLHEKISKKIMYGTILSLLGVAFIVLKPIVEQGFHGDFLGNFLFLLSTFASLPYYFVLKRIIHNYSPAKLTFWVFFFGQLCFLPAVIWETQQPGYYFFFNIQSVLGIIFGSLFSSMLAWLMQAYALKFLLASEVTIFSYLDPIFTAVAAVLLLGEKITITYILGSLLVFAGIFIAEGRLYQNRIVHHHHRVRGF